jgi:chorismate mutase
MSDPLEPLRDEIDAVDRRIVGAVNERLAIVERLWRLKADRGLDRLDPERERSILDSLRAANAGPLTEEGLRELVAELLALTKREHERHPGGG